MNALTLRTLSTFPTEHQSQVRAHRFDDINELVQQVALALLEANSDDTIRAIFNRARSATRRFRQNLAHYCRSLDAVENIAAGDVTETAAARTRRLTTREITADFGVTTRRGRQIVAAQIERARMGDLFADYGHDDDGEDE